MLKKTKSKKTTSILLSLGIVLSMLVVVTFSASAAEDNCSQTGDGDFTEIKTVEDLYMVNLDLAGNYKLMNDIDLTEATKKGGDWDYGGRGWEPIGSNGNYGNNPFTGVFDGNGHEIKGMRIEVDSVYSGYQNNLPQTITDNNEIYLGLFTTNSGTIKNLTVSGNIKGRGYLRYAGGIVGKNIKGNIEKCVNKCQLSLRNASDYAHFWSGIAGTSSNGYISECYNMGDITITTSGSGGYSASGITCEGSVIENSYNTGKITANNSYSYYADHTHASGIAKYGTISNCYNIGMVDAYNKYSISGSNVTNCYYLDGTGTGKVGTKSLTPAQMKMQMMYVGFDFKNVWFIDSQSEYVYPQLINNNESKHIEQIVIEDIEINIGDTELIEVNFIPEDTTDSKKITWVSSDDTIATVDSNGNITGHKCGTAIVTATTVNGKQATFTVNVSTTISLGDVNSDGVVDVLDAAMIQKYTVNRVNLNEEQLLIGDVNNDSHVDVLDAAEIQKYASGIITEFKKKA